MSQRSVTHASFVVERTYPAAPSRVFAAFADPEIKARWFGAPDDWEKGEASLDFRVGGREVSVGGPKGGPVHAFEGRFQDIVANERIVYTYDMHLDDTRISVSLTTIEFKAAGAGTRLVFTEYGAYLDGYEDAGAREHGTGILLDQLGAEMARQTAAA
jgi:uncharacterized protein YndB with AHSA1/START domain